MNLYFDKCTLLLLPNDNYCALIVAQHNCSELVHISQHKFNNLAYLLRYCQKTLKSLSPRNLHLSLGLTRGTECGPLTCSAICYESTTYLVIFTTYFQFKSCLQSVDNVRSIVFLRAHCAFSMKKSCSKFCIFNVVNDAQVQQLPDTSYTRSLESLVKPLVRNRTHWGGVTIYWSHIVLQLWYTVSTIATQPDYLNGTSN